KLGSTDLSFVQALPNHTLTSLTWVGRSKYTDLPNILKHQGKSLQSLEFRCQELECPRFLPTFDYRILPTHTHNLRHLSANVHRNGTWPLDVLEHIAAIPTLRSADLWMGIQSECRKQYEDYTNSQRVMEREFGKDYCKGEDQFQKPLLDDTSALKLFKYMRERKIGAGLDEVTIWVGDWTRAWDGPLYFPAWAEGIRAKVVCKAEADVNMKDWCVVEEGKEYWKDE
ncbi:hypothetical protein BDW02DRAFT_474822, partial [Decorospora gaudefroyi]